MNPKCATASHALSAIGFRRRGFILADAITGMAILAMLTAIVTVEISWRSKADRRLTDYRAAVALAEGTLAEMQQGHAPAPSAAGDHIHIDRLADDSPSPHFQWVRIIATHNGQSASLIGLAKAATGGGP